MNIYKFGQIYYIFTNDYNNYIKLYCIIYLHIIYEDKIYTEIYYITYTYLYM